VHCPSRRWVKRKETHAAKTKLRRNNDDFISLMARGRMTCLQQ
jgi:hypothetical protein